MLFRNRFLTRAMACFLLLETVVNLALPTVSWAMMGPSQPEFTAYQGPGATDMVNLSTGDFSYSIPLLDIPGPERSFSLPLTYKAGIPLEQEATWVGLGWSLNPGALARNVIGYPDDAAHDTVQSNYNKFIERGIGLNWGFYNLALNSNTGMRGSIDLLGLASLNWDNNGITGGDLVGISYQGGEGFSINPVRMAMAAFTIATMGTSSLPLAANVGLQLGASAAIGIGMAAAGIGRMGGIAGYNTEPTLVTNSSWGVNAHVHFFNKRATEYTYGALHFGDMSQWKPNWQNEQQLRGPDFTVNGVSVGRAQPFHNNRSCDDNGNVTAETAADVHQYNKKSDHTYFDSGQRPLSTAHDFFSVMGEGVSGSIRPYRLDMGSVAYPQIGTKRCFHYKYSAVSFLPENTYKVRFRYDNSISNSYDYHDYQPASGASPTGFDPTHSGSTIAITDPRLQDNGPRTGAARPGLYDGSTGGNRRLVQGKHVVWYTNQEIRSMYSNSVNGNGNGFLEFQLPTAVNGSHNPYRDRLRPTAIGAFSVTSEDGTTYHYSLPVHQFKIHAQSDELNHTVGAPGRATHDEKGYITTWLLTAITSADYIDRNQSGTVDAEDWGGWVKFQYGKFSSVYKWRQPYLGTSYAEDDPSLKMATFMEGYKETYYLNSISTRSHTALFVKSVREDGRGHFRPGISRADSHLGIDESLPASSLRLDEIILLDNVTLAKVQSPNGIPANGGPTPVPALNTATGRWASLPNGPISSSDNMNNVLDMVDLFTDQRVQEFVYANAVRRIRFNYDYDLCRGTPNSFPYAASAAALPPMSESQMSEGRGGKLTLKGVSTFGPSLANVPTKIIPDFSFAYGGPDDNPKYSKELWDGFGMYCPSGQRNVTSHTADNTGNAAAAWSLTKITSPLGGTTEVSYERDQYAHVSEHGNTKIRLYHDTDCGLELLVDKKNFRGDIAQAIKPGMWLALTGEARYDCQQRVTNPSNPLGSPLLVTTHANRRYDSRWVRVHNLIQRGGGYVVQLEAGYQPTSQTRYDSQCSGGGPFSRGMSFETTLPENKPGGDIRVAAIKTADEAGNAYRVRYMYTTTAPATTGPMGEFLVSNSSGVMAKEPDFIGRFVYDFEGNFDYPATPVLYSKVTVFRGRLTSGGDNWDQREVYSFHTPRVDMITYNHSPYYAGFNNGDNKQVALFANRVAVNTGRIGQPSQVQVYNRHGQMELSTDFTYSNTVANTANQPKQGRFTEALLSNDLLDNVYYRINRTVKEYLPTVMSGSRSTRNGVSIESSNSLYDFYTGQVVETSFRNSHNQVFHSRSVPARR